MLLRLRAVRCSVLLLSALIGLASCAAPSGATPAARPTASPVPTAAPSATPAPPQVAAGVRVATIDLAGMTAAQARRKLEAALAPLRQPLTITAGTAQLTLRVEDLSYALDLDPLVAQALSAPAATSLDIHPSYDQPRLRRELAAFNQRLAPAAISLISTTGMISRSFALDPGQRFDLDLAVQRIDQQLRSPDAARTVRLAPLGAARPTDEQLQQQIDAMAELWDGVVGIYVYDLKRQQVIATRNPNTVFSGASIIKVPIMLQSYLELPKLNDDQRGWMRQMVIVSDNLAANSLLAASVGGGTTEAALEGAQQMSARLRQLGLSHTYQNMPFEATDYLINQRGFTIPRGPAREGDAPFTEADPFLRTTPAEISQIFLWIQSCGAGGGRLIEEFGQQISAARCREMLDLLAHNGDQTRLASGLPAEAHLAHKSGWTEDMQADVGLISSPGGDFLLAVYLYRQVPNGYLPDEIAAPVIGRFARLVYSFYNPAQR